MNELQTLKDAASKLSEQERAMRAKHAALVAERKAVVAAYLPVADVIANMEGLVDAASASFAQTHGVQVVRSFSGYKEAPSSPGRSERSVAPRLPLFGDGTLTLKTLCGITPALVKARLADVIRSSGVKFGLSPEERKAKLEQIDSDIASVETDHTSLVEGAAEVGIAMPFLDAVRERREREAREKARADQAAKDRAAGIFPVGA